MGVILWSIFFLVVLSALLIFILGWYRKKSYRKLVKNYNESEDKSRQGREVGEGREGKRIVEETSPSVPRPRESKGRGLLQTATTISSSDNKPRPKKISGLLARIRRRTPSRPIKK